MLQNGQLLFCSYQILQHYCGQDYMVNHLFKNSTWIGYYTPFEFLLKRRSKPLCCSWVYQGTCTTHDWLQTTLYTRVIWQYHHHGAGRTAPWDSTWGCIIFGTAADSASHMRFVPSSEVTTNSYY